MERDRESSEDAPRAGVGAVSGDGESHRSVGGSSCAAAILSCIKGLGLTQKGAKLTARLSTSIPQVTGDLRRDLSRNLVHLPVLGVPVS